MKIFIEHRGSRRHPWLCLLAETLDEKNEIDRLYQDAQADGYCIDNSVEWQQQGYKLMFILQIEQHQRSKGYEIER